MSDLLIGARAVQFASSLLVAGAASFSSFVVAPALHESPQAGASLKGRMKLLMLAGIGLAVLSGAAWLLAVAAELGDTSPLQAAADGGLVWSVLTATRFGEISAFRFGLACVLAILLLTHRTGSRREWVLLLAAIFTASLAAQGHAGADVGADGDVHFVNDGIHLLAASLWAGGLLPFLVTLGGGTEPDANTRSAIVRRFSSLAFLSVAVLVASGIVNAAYMVETPADLIRTAYGNILLIKLGLFAGMLLCGALNRYWLGPRIPAGVTGSAADRTYGLLSASVAAEIGLAILVCIAVAMLGQLQPPGHSS